MKIAKDFLLLLYSERLRSVVCVWIIILFEYVNTFLININNIKESESERGEKCKCVCVREKEEKEVYSIYFIVYICICVLGKPKLGKYINKYQKT